MAEISKLSKVAIGDVAKVNAVTKANIANINDLTVPSAGGALFLDLYTGATAAWSVRRLNTAYTGACLRVRRDSDNTEQDIGFDGSGNIDTAAIASFVGSGNNGYVRTWYGQDSSGGTGSGLDAEQTTNNNQPLIYNGTAVVTKNGKPALETNGTSQYLTFTSTSFTGDFAFLNVQTFFQDSPYGDVGYGGASGDFGAYGLNATTIRWRLSNTTSNFAIPTETNGAQYFAFADRSSNSMSVHYQGVSRGTTSNSGTAAFYQIMAGNGTGGLLLDGHSQELIFYSKSMSSDRTAMMSNVNTYFSIY